MLQRETKPDAKLKTIEFWITASIDPEVANEEQLACKLADALTWVEGVGKVEVKVIDTLISND